MKLSDIIISVLVFVILGWILYGQCREPRKEIVSRVETIEHVRRDTVYIPRVVVIDSSRVDSILCLQTIDTLAILRTFYTIHHYADTLQDSLYRIVILDKISENKILERNIFSDIQQRTVTITKTPTPKIGFMATASVGIQHAEVNALLVTRQRWCIGLGYEFIGKTPILTLGYQFR